LISRSQRKPLQSLLAFTASTGSKEFLPIFKRRITHSQRSIKRISQGTISQISYPRKVNHIQKRIEVVRITTRITNLNTTTKLKIFH